MAFMHVRHYFLQLSAMLNVFMAYETLAISTLRDTCFMEFEPNDDKNIIIESYCAKQIIHAIYFRNLWDPYGICMVMLYFMSEKTEASRE